MAGVLSSDPSRFVRLMARGYSMQGIVKSPAVYEAAANAAVEWVFHDPSEPNARMLSNLTERICGKVTVDAAQRVQEALDYLDRGSLMVTTEPHKVRVIANFGIEHDVLGRKWAVQTIFKEGLRPHALVPSRHAIPLGVSCMVEEVPDYRYPFVIADVPRNYVPELEQAKRGEKCTLPRLPKDFIVGMNGIAFATFEAAWRARVVDGAPARNRT